MKYKWIDYNAETMGYVETWIDDLAVRMTGLDDGWRDFYEYWFNYEHNELGENFWCKVICEYENPFAIIALGMSDGNLVIMELVVRPDMRNKGKGASLLKELIENSKIILNTEVGKAEAIIYPSNIASQKSFEKAGFVFDSNEDGDAITYVYNKS